MKHYVYKILFGIKRFLADHLISMKGQKNNYRILQTAHRIEKGLLYSKPKKMWGWKKVEDLILHIQDEYKQKIPDAFAIETGGSVICAYIKSKLQSRFPEDVECAKHFVEKYNKNISEFEAFNIPSGTLTVYKNELGFLLSEQERVIISRLFTTRHSVRSFDKTPIREEDITRAVELALRCPTACNRQPVKVYSLSAERREKIGYENSFGADRYLIITADINAYTRSEYNDWIVTGSIFCGYLTLALHSLGIGSCVMRKDLVFGSEYNDSIKRVCKIPAEEKIIIEMAVGYYRESFDVAASNRKKSENVVASIY